MTQETHHADAAELIAKADALLISAGAGMGVDSGLPDFRGNDGFWAAYPALARMNLDFTQIASPQSFAIDPTLAWGFYGHRLNLYRSTHPHNGFDILRRWTARMAFGSWAFTSNVDGQFQKAGFLASNITECHGSIHFLQCTQPCTSATWSAEGYFPTVDDVQCRLLNEPPRCPHCGAIARPNILMFDDWKWVHHSAQLQRERQEAWLNHVANKQACLVVIEIGAGIDVSTVRHHSESVCRRFGAKLIRINPRVPQVPYGMGLDFAAPAAQTLQLIDQACLTKGGVRTFV